MEGPNSDRWPYNLVAPSPGTTQGLGRSGMIVITILAMLVLGLLVVAFIPQRGNASVSRSGKKWPISTSIMQN